MKSKLRSLVKRLYAGNINEEEFLKEYFNGRLPSETHVLHLLEYAIVGKDGDLVEEAMVLLCTGYFKTDSFFILLCQLLTEDWHTKHEDIATLLKQIKSP